MADVIPLPNDKWVRYPNDPLWAYNLDPDDKTFFAWHMQYSATFDTWFSYKRISITELHLMYQSHVYEAHRESILRALAICSLC